MAIQELKALEGSNSFIRIAFQQDIPVTSRVLRLIDSEAFQRLKQIPQLGFVRTVYPSATHTRFEHSLGSTTLPCNTSDIFRLTTTLSVTCPMRK